jgi:hypothetical protein
MIRQSAPLQVAMVAYSCVGVSRVTIRSQFARIARWRAYASRQTRYLSSPTIGHRVSRKAITRGRRSGLLPAGESGSEPYRGATRRGGARRPASRRWIERNVWRARSFDQPPATFPQSPAAP